MAGLFYSVDLSANSEMARDSRYVEKFLVELVCEKHSDQRYDCRNSACEIAMKTRNAETVTIIAYQVAVRVIPVPTNHGEGFKAPCGCRAWHF
jgi:hypothetical protein